MSVDQCNLIIEKLDEVNTNIEITNNFFGFSVSVVVGVFVCFILWKAIDNFLGF